MVMSEWDGTAWAGSEPQTRAVDYADGSLAYFADRLGFYGSGTRAWHLPTIRDALGVPAIARSVTLVAFTGGSLTPQAFRDGRLVETPRVIVRPDPFQTPRDFYRDVYWNMATYGETVLWIAHRDGQGYPDALINVPATELMVEDNPRNRLFPIYRWGQLEGSRWSPVNPRGQFVHITYAKYPGALRGVGPLQLCQAAVSVAVEAQEWAANFYGDGGHPSVLIKHAGELSPERKNADTYLPDPDGSTEADLLRAQWVDKPNNVPRVIDQRIESVDYVQPNPQGAQMLDARNYQNGDAARAFGIPGELLEYAAGGSSLTYKNLADVWINFVRGCLAPRLPKQTKSWAQATPRRSRFPTPRRPSLCRGCPRFDRSRSGSSSGATACTPVATVAGTRSCRAVTRCCPIPASSSAGAGGARRTGPRRLDALRGSVHSAGMTLAEAADALGLSPDTLRSQIRYGRFAARKVGRDWHTTPREVERYRREVLGRAGRRKSQ
jgi:hypothetical protein